MAESTLVNTSTINTTGGGYNNNNQSSYYSSSGGGGGGLTQLATSVGGYNDYSGALSPQAVNTNYNINTNVTNQSAAAANYANYCGSGSYENSYGYGAAPKTAQQQQQTAAVAASSSTTSSSSETSAPHEIVTELFLTVEGDENGRISFEEAERLLLRLNSKLNRSYGEHDVHAFFQSLDVDRADGSVDVKEVRSAFERLV